MCNKKSPLEMRGLSVSDIEPASAPGGGDKEGPRTAHAPLATVFPRLPEGSLIGKKKSTQRGL